MPQPGGDAPLSFRDGDSGAPPSSTRLPRGEFRPETVVDPPPKFRTVDFRVPPDAMVGALIDGVTEEGVRVRLVDREERHVLAVDDLDGGLHATVTLSVEPTDAGSRVRLVYDRPPGTRMDPAADDRRLGVLLASVEREIPRALGG